MRRWLLPLLCLALLCLPASADAVSFVIRDYVMDVRIESDGAGFFDETLVYEYDGDYNGMLVTIHHEGGPAPAELHMTVDDVPLQWVIALDDTPHTYTASTSDTVTSLKIYAPGKDDTRVLRITYRLDNIALRYADTARINHTLLYSEADYDSVTFRVDLPGGDDAAVDWFVHGAIPQAQARLSDGTLTLGPAAVRDGDRIEIDVLFPAGWLSTAAVNDQPMRDAALAQEAEIAEAQAREERVATILGLVILGLILAYFIFCVILFLRLRGKYGTKQHIVPVTDDALLGSLPAACAQVIHLGSANASGLTATLLELCNLGVLRLDTDVDTTTFTCVDRLRGGLEPHQQMLLDWLFDGRNTLDMDALDMEGDAKAATAFNKQYNRWKSEVIEDTAQHGWIWQNSGARTGAAIAGPIVFLILSAFLFRFGLWPFGILGILLAALFAVLYTRIRKRTDDGDAREAAIQGFLDNYDDRLYAEPESVIGRVPLVMALGYMEPLAEWLDEHPEPYHDDAFTYGMYAGYWHSPGWHHRALSAEKSVREAQSTNAGTEFSGGNSSSGGFSGGSGGSSHGGW